jgi:hypothetical protein
MGITYPCSGETINPGVFATHTQTMQDAISEVAALQASLLGPPAVLVRRAAFFQLVTASVTTAATFEAECYDTDSMFDVGSPGQLTVRSAGTYLVNYNLLFGGSVNSVRVAILVNGVEFAYEKSDEGTSAVDASIWVSALLPSLAVGSVIIFNIFFTGAGNLSGLGIASATRLSTI